MAVMNMASGTSVVEGITAMFINPLRTTLSTLGVVMGIASVIATLALADGMERFARSQLAAQTDVQAITVSSKTQEIREGFAFPNRTYPIFSLRDAAELQSFLGSEGDVTMSVGGQAIVTTSTAPPHAASVTATLANFLLIGEKDVAIGRYFTEIEVTRNAPVLVLSYKLAAELSPDRDPRTMLGREVRVRGRSLAVIGVMPSYTGETGFQIYIPLRAAGAALGAQRLTPAMLVRAPTLESVDATKQSIVEWLATRYRDWQAQVVLATSLARLEQARAAMLVLKLVMAGFASIALVVGGVGIMNVLLASVTERTREIGVRKAMGARRRDILFQFLAESVAIAGVGTGVGTVVGLSVAFAVAALVRWRVPGAQLHAAVTPATLATGIVSAAVIGLSFGTFPALRAARLSPIDAIRHE
jgi:putative ABC transport system permease protein